MTQSPEDWQNYPYLVEWVDSVNKWAEDYEIYEFMPADNQGLDPSGQFSEADYYPMLPKFTTESTGGFGGEGSKVWTLHDAADRLILPDFLIGAASSWCTIGWYLGRIPHGEKGEVLNYMNEVCPTCEGQGSYFVPGSDDEVECYCAGDPVFVELEHTSSKTNQVSGQERNKAIGPEGILHFEIGPLLDPELFEYRLKNL